MNITREDHFIRDLISVSSSKGVGGAVNVVKFTKDGSYCMSGGDDRAISLFNPHKSDPSITKSDVALLVKSYEGVHGYTVLDLAIAADKCMPQILLDINDMNFE